MGNDAEIDALRQELASMQARLDELETSGEPTRGPVTRRGLLMGVAGAGAAAVVGVVSTDPAAASDEDPLKLGAANTSSTKTTLTHTAAQTNGYPAVDVTSNGRISVTIENTVTEDPLAALAVSSLQDLPTQFTRAVWARAAKGFAVLGENDTTGLPSLAGENAGTGPGLGGSSAGGGPQLYLETDAFGGNGQIGPPAAGPQAIGGLRLDAAGDLWVCTAAGTPGTWTKYLRADNTSGRVIPISPVRALDSRATGGRPAGTPAIPGPKKGPLKGGAGVTLDLAGVSPIPADASGVVGNLTVVGSNFSGYVTARPSDATSTTSSLNFGTGAIVANAFTSKLGPGGLTVIASGTASHHYELIVDITAYIT